MARRKYEKTKQQLNVNATIQPQSGSYEPLMRAADVTSQNLTKLLQAGADLSFNEFKKEALKKAQRRAVDNDLYVEYYNTKDNLGLEDRLTNELVINEIQTDYVEKVSTLAKDFKDESLLKSIPTEDFRILLDRKVDEIYKDFRTQKIDSPQLELEARKVLAPFLKRLKLNYRDELIAAKKSSLSTGQKKRALDLAKFAGDMFYTKDKEEAENNLKEYLEEHPDIFRKYAIDITNKYEEGKLYSLVQESKAKDLKYNNLSELQVKYNIIDNVKSDLKNANSALYREKQTILNNIKTAAGTVPEAAVEHAEARFNMNHGDFLEENRDKLAPELMAMYHLIDSNIQHLNENNYIDFIRMHNKIIYPMNVTIREPDGTISPMVDIDVPFFKNASQESLQKYAETRMEQYKKDPTKFMEAIAGIKSNVLDANNNKIPEIANRRFEMGVPVIGPDEITPFLNDINTLQSRDEALFKTLNFFEQFNLNELQGLSYSMLTKLPEPQKVQFFKYLNATIQDKIQNNEFDVLRTTFLGDEKIKNYEQGLQKENAKANDTTLQNEIVEYVEENVTSEMSKSGIKPLTTKNIQTAMRAYIYGNQDIAFGDDISNREELIVQAFRAVTGYKEDALGNEQVNGYGSIGDYDSIIHVREEDRKFEFSGIPVGVDSMNDTFDIMDTAFMNDYLYYVNPKTGAITKLEGGVSTIYAPLPVAATYSDYLTRIEPEKQKEIVWTSDMARNGHIKNSKAYSDFYSFKDNQSVLQIDIEGVPVEVMFDMKAATYDFKKYVEPNLPKFLAAIENQDYVEKGYINIGPGDIGSATYTRRFLTRKPREGDILIAPNGTRIKYTEKFTPNMKTMIEIRDRAKELETKAGTSIGPFRVGTTVSNFFPEE